MSYIELGYQFLDYFINCVNSSGEELRHVIKPDTQLTINDMESIGPDDFMGKLYSIGIHNLKIEAKYVIVQPLYWKNIYRNNYDGIIMLASGSANVLENGCYVNKNVHFTFILENIQDGYYINNLIARFSEKSRPIVQPQPQVTFNPYNQVFNQSYNPWNTSVPMDTGFPSYY